MNSKDILSKTRKYTLKQKRIKDISNIIKNKKNLTRKIKLTNENYRIINLNIIIIFFTIIRGLQFALLSKDSYITLKINAVQKLILFRSIDGNRAYRSLTLPDRIEFKGNNYTNISFEYTIVTNTVNREEVKLIWEKNNQPKSTEGLFQGCGNCIVIDLSNFDFSQVTSMYRMFYHCEYLSSVKLSNINTSYVEIMDSLFTGCKSLESLDLSEFDTSNTRSMFHMFNDCYKLKSLNLSNFNTAKVIYMHSMFSGCLLLNELDISNFNTSKTETMQNMFNNCPSLISLNLSHFDTSSVSDMSNMFNGCSKLISLNLSNFNTSKAKIEKMFYNCSNLQYIILKIAEINGINNQEIFSLTSDNLTVCSENDGWKNLLSSEHLTINCKNTNTNRNSFKCYQKVFYNNNINKNCEFCGTNFIYHIFKNNINELLCFENETIFIDEIINKLLCEINTTKLNKGKDEEIEEENLKIVLTTTQNQKNKENENVTTINLDECEDELKWYYNISLNDSLYIIKLDINIEGMKIPKIEYEVYYPLNSSSELIKLNLSICQNKRIKLTIPVLIDENLDKYNISSGYYKDICTKATSKNSTDITLSDRKNEFIKDNLTLCEENCQFIEYNYTNKKAKCSCDIKINIQNIDSIKFDIDLLKKSFIDINNILNLKIMKCYQNVFNKNNLKNNIGFIIIFCIIFLFLISFIIFIFKSIKTLYNDINKIILAKRKIKFNNNTNKNEFITNAMKKKKNEKKTKKKRRKKKNIINNSKNEYTNNILKETSKKKNRFNDGTNNLNLSKNIDKKYNEILKYKDYELNSLSFEKALTIDKRNFLQYYISSIKINNLLIFSFLPTKDYNPMIIKIFLFFFFFTLNLTVNALFFNDDTMHKIYIDGGKYNFIYQISQILYSSLISGVISTLIKYLSLSQDNIMDLKHSKDNKNLKANHKKLIINIKIKFISFFIVVLLLLLFFWYYISCFCGIYTNTQIHLLKDSIIGFGLSLLDPFWQWFLLGIIRIYSLKNKNEYLYKLFLFLSNLC